MKLSCPAPLLKHSKLQRTESIKMGREVTFCLVFLFIKADVQLKDTTVLILLLLAQYMKRLSVTSLHLLFLFGC